MRRAWIVLVAAIVCIVPSGAGAQGEMFGVQVHTDHSEWFFSEDSSHSFSDTDWQLVQAEWLDFSFEPMLDSGFSSLSMDSVSTTSFPLMFASPFVWEPEIEKIKVKYTNDKLFNNKMSDVSKNPPRCTIVEYESLIPSPSDRFHDVQACDNGLYTTYDPLNQYPVPKDSLLRCVKEYGFPITDRCGPYTAHQYELQYRAIEHSYFCTQPLPLDKVPKEQEILIQNLNNDVCNKK